jgi:hypothetical protein
MEELRGGAKNLENRAPHLSTGDFFDLFTQPIYRIFKKCEKLCNLLLGFVVA